MKKSLLFAAFCGGLVYLTGCGPTVAEITEMHNKDLVAGNFTQSMPHMEKLIAEDEKNSHEDTPMWRLMVSNAKMISGTDAIQDFDKAEDVILNNDKKDKSLVLVKAMAINDKFLPFAPGFQDRMFIGLDKALMYSEKGKTNEARTELNRMMQYQEFWLKERIAEINASKKAMDDSLKPAAKDEKSDLPPAVVEKINELKAEAAKAYDNLLKSDTVLGLVVKNVGFDLQNNPDISALKPQDYQNAYATHFCGIFRTLNKDNGSSFLKDAAALKPASAVVAKDYADVAANKVLKNEVWVYVEDGLCSVKEESRIDLPIGLVPFVGNYVKYMGMALPKLVERASAAENYSVGDAKMEELENIDRLLKTEYSVYMGSAVKRDLLRSLLKTLPQVAAGIMAEKMPDPMAKAGLTAAQYAAAGYALASTQADLRVWNVLPKRVMVQRVSKPADGKLVIKADTETFEVKVPQNDGENCIVWIRKVAKKSPFIHKVISFPVK